MDNLQENPTQVFERLFKSNYIRLYKCAMHLVKDSDMAKDVVQDVFVKCWKKHRDLYQDDKLDRYLLIATSRTALNYLRNQKHTLRLNAVDNDKLKSTSPLKANKIETEELEADIERAIESLPAQCRVIFQLSRQEGLKYQQIAETLDISIKTVENQMGIAFQKLKQKLKSHLPSELMIIAVVLGSSDAMLKYFL